MKKIIFTIILFIIPIITYAYCDSEDIVEQSKLLNNININYEYDYQNQVFTIIFTNINKNFNVIDQETGEMYDNLDEIKIEKISGNHSFLISSEQCSYDVNRTRYIDLPYYNKYYDSEDCRNIQNYSYCNKWVNNPINENLFKQKIEAYKKNIEKKEQTTTNNQTNLNKFLNRLADLYVKYYFIFLPIIIVSLSIIIYRKNKKDQLF